MNFLRIWLAPLRYKETYDSTLYAHFSEFYQGF